MAEAPEATRRTRSVRPVVDRIVVRMNPSPDLAIFLRSIGHNGSRRDLRGAVCRVMVYADVGSGFYPMNYLTFHKRTNGRIKETKARTRYGNFFLILTAFISNRMENIVQVSTNIEGINT